MPGAYGAPPAGAFGAAAAAGFASTMAAPPSSFPMGPGGGAGSLPTPPPVAVGTSAGPSGSDGMVQCPRCNSRTPSSFAYCQQCGLHLQAMAPTDPGGAVRAGMIGPGSGGVPAGLAASAGASPTAPGGIDPQGATMAVSSDGPRLPLPGKGAASWGTAVLVNRDGSDGERFALSGDYVDIGRAGATIAFEQDRFLALRHARIERTGDGARLVSLDPLNGVFRKLELPVDLDDGAVLLVGREVLRYERVADDERDAEPLVQHGVALFGSPPRAPWGRLSELLPSGGVRDIRHLNGDEVVLGREEGELVFRDDAFMSRRHAAINWDGQRARLTDLGSSNGTFLRLTSATALRHKDHLRMGDQLFRIELR
jgi:FHA domain